MSRGTILVVEDDSDWHYKYQVHLERFGYQIQFAENIEEGLGILLADVEEQKIGYVIVDYILNPPAVRDLDLPAMTETGSDFIERAREQLQREGKSRKHPIKFVIVSEAAEKYSRGKKEVLSNLGKMKLSVGPSVDVLHKSLFNHNSREAYAYLSELFVDVRAAPTGEKRRRLLVGLGVHNENVKKTSITQYDNLFFAIRSLIRTNGHVPLADLNIDEMAPEDLVRLFLVLNGGAVSWIVPHERSNLPREEWGFGSIPAGRFVTSRAIAIQHGEEIDGKTTWFTVKHSDWVELARYSEPDKQDETDEIESKNADEPKPKDPRILRVLDAVAFENEHQLANGETPAGVFSANWYLSSPSERRSMPTRENVEGQDDEGEEEEGGSELFEDDVDEVDDEDGLVERDQADGMQFKSGQQTALISAVKTALTMTNRRLGKLETDALPPGSRFTRQIGFKDHDKEVGGYKSLGEIRFSLYWSEAPKKSGRKPKKSKTEPKPESKSKDPFRKKPR